MTVHTHNQNSLHSEETINDTVENKCNQKYMHNNTAALCTLPMKSSQDSDGQMFSF